jgi:arsenite methyltransferase
MKHYIRYILSFVFVIIQCSLALPEDGNTAFGSYNEYRQVRIEEPQRKEWQKPEKVVDHLLIKNGDWIADIGAGTGYFTVLFAEKTGKNGRVFAVDVDPEMIKYLKDRAFKENLGNIEYILSPPENPLLPKSLFDLIFICDTYVFLENRDQYLHLLKEALKEDGKIAVISFHMTSKPDFPPPPGKRIPKEGVTGEFLKAGFKLESEHFFLPYQYFLIFSKG